MLALGRTYIHKQQVKTCNKGSAQKVSLTGALANESSVMQCLSEVNENVSPSNLASITTLVGANFPLSSSAPSSICSVGIILINHAELL